MKPALIAVFALFLAMPAHAQQAQQQPRTQPAPAPTTTQPRTTAAVQNPPATPGLPVNVRIDVAVIDTRGAMSKREVVTVTSADREQAYSRAGGNGSLTGAYTLNVDATPVVSGMPTGKVRVRLSLDYNPVRAPEQNPNTGGVARTQLQFSLVLDDGKMMVASDTSDPASDRRVRVEVTATILK